MTADQQTVEVRDQLAELRAEVQAQIETALVRITQHAGDDINDAWPQRISAIGRELAYLGGGLLGFLLIRWPIARAITSRLEPKYGRRSTDRPPPTANVNPNPPPAHDPPVLREYVTKSSK